MRLRPGAAGALAAVAIAAAGPPAVPAAGRDATVVASRATGVNGEKARGPFDPFGPSQLSVEGRYATFSSSAVNLDPADHDTTVDVFMRDLNADVTTLISRADGADGPKGNGSSAVGDAAVGGRYVVFNSLSSNLDPADTDDIRDIYLRDVVSGDTTLVSRATGLAGAKGNGDSIRGRLSADGHLVAFGSNASNLDPADPDPDLDVFVRDLSTDRTTLVSEGVATAEFAAFSDDGHHIAYVAGGDLYVRDLRAGLPVFVGRPSNPVGITLSADGRYVAFSSRAKNLDPADRDGVPDVYVRDVAAGTTTLASRADGRRGVKGNAASMWGGSLSANGRYVVFDSSAWNLDPVDSRSDRSTDIFVRDLRNHRTVLASRSASGAKGNRSSHLATISGDGRHVVFTSHAVNLDPSDRNYRYQVYVRDLTAPLPVPGRPPRSSIRSVKQIGESGQAGLSVTGRASDDGEVQVVEVSLTRRLPDGRCQRWSTVWVPTASSGGRCRPRFDLAAHFTSRWWRRFDAEILPGTYELLSRAIDTAGRRERVFSEERGNRRAFRIR